MGGKDGWVDHLGGEGKGRGMSWLLSCFPKIVAVQGSYPEDLICVRERVGEAPRSLSFSLPLVSDFHVVHTYIPVRGEGRKTDLMNQSINPAALNIRTLTFTE